MNHRISAIVLLFVFSGWIVLLPVPAAAGSPAILAFTKKPATLQKKAPATQAAPQSSSRKVLESEQTEQQNKMVEEQNEEIEEMKDEAEKLEEELKELEQGGGG